VATIKDVAKLAGVSISTVSYALNNSGSVSEETKKKILKAAKELQYKPNATARNLKKKKTDTIGLFLSDLGGPFYSEIMRGIQEVAYNNDYDLIVCSDYCQKNSTAYKFLKEKRVDGAIIMAPSIQNKLIEEAGNPSFPVIVLDRELQGENIYNVLIDNVNGAYLAVKHLIEQGCKNIGFLSGSGGSYDNSKRFEGYKRILTENNLIYKKEWHINGEFTENGGYEAVKVLINEGNLPEAIFSANDEMAIGAIKAFDEYGIKVPGDIAIVGFDDIKLSSYIQPKLTTVRHPKYELGLLAAHMMFKALKGEQVSKSVTLSTELIVRESCKK
jgi:LacI family transcriptional regulator